MKQVQPVAVVTGAGSGIGRAISLDLSGRGYRIVLAGRRAGPLRETASMLQTPSLVQPCDVANPDACANLIDSTVAYFGRLDALINNAGFAPSVAIGKTEPALIQQVFAVNALGPAYLIAAAWRVFERQFKDDTFIAAFDNDGGCIVNISSMATVDPFPNLFAYAAAKGALNVMVKSCMNEGHDMGMRCFCIAPGAVDTAMLRQVVSEEMLPRERTIPPRVVAGIVGECVTGERDEDCGKIILVPSEPDAPA